MFGLISDVFDIKKKRIVELGDGSEWMLSKCLTHANRTVNLMDNLINKWCTGEDIIFSLP